MLAGTVGSSAGSASRTSRKKEGSMDIGGAKISCAPVCFALQYRDIDGGAPHGQGADGQGGNDADQGVGLKLSGTVTAKKGSCRGFECSDIPPPYNSTPKTRNAASCSTPPSP